MNLKDLIFDNFEECETYIQLEGMREQVCIALSDDLMAYEEELSEQYKEQIAAFVAQHNKWMEGCLKEIAADAKSAYNISPNLEEVDLLNIYVLFEQGDSPIFGLGFWTAFDTEHGCGIKITGNSLHIMEVGDASVAFC